MASSGWSWISAVIPARQNRAIAALVALTPLVCGAAGSSFPGTAASHSPDKKWELTSDPPQKDEGHKLVLRDVAKQTNRQLLSFDRHVEAIWAQDSRRVAVTDYSGSDASDCRVFDVVAGSETATSKSLMDSDLVKVMTGNHHAFLKCLKWRSPLLLEIEVEAYGDAHPKGYKRLVVFDVLKNQVTNP